MATQYTYPENAELQLIDQEYIGWLTADDEIFQMFPMVNQDSHKLLWDQLDVYAGLQNVRGMGGQPGRVRQVGANRFEMDPGVYGDFIEIEEEELLARRELGQFGNPIDLTDLVAMAEQHLTQREIDRIRLTLWTLVTTGTFSVTGENGQILHTDSFPVQTTTPATPWSTVASATPLADIRLAQATYQPGHYVKFDSKAKIFMNSVTKNNVLNNNNSNDLFGRRVNQGETINSLAEANRILLDNDLPQIVVYDRGYYNKPINQGGTFSRFIPNGKAVMIGNRENKAVVGEYRMTRNASNPDMEPGSYIRVVDNAELGTNPVPRKIAVHKGHNGGPVIYFPSAVVVFNI